MMNINNSNKHLKINMILNGIKGLMGVIFPLISFPYVSKVLGVENIGKYNFSTSIISYFLLIAALGINSYAVREGAKLRENSREFCSFANEMFTINTLSTVLSYLLLVLTVVCVPKLHLYYVYIMILSLQIVFTTFGVEWVYSVYENYLYITIRSILFYCLSLALLFILVRDVDDLIAYCFVSVLSNAGCNILNFIHARKYCKLRLTRSVDWIRHLKPILILFSTQLATTIYVSSDTTMLGFLCNDTSVGIYSVSSKVYTIVKTILSSILVVSIPRLASFLGKNDKESYKRTCIDIYSTLITFVIPSILGIFLLRKEIVLLISDSTYIEATDSLAILCGALFFCLGAWFWGQCVLVTNGKEAYVLKATILSAIINVSLNFILIPLWKEKAAALTTLIAEMVAFILQSLEGRKIVTLSNINKTYLKVLTGCIPIVVVSEAARQFVDNMFFYVAFVILISVICYFGVEILLKNQAVYSLKMLIKGKHSAR